MKPLEALNLKFRRLVFRRLKSIGGGRLEVRDAAGSRVFGDPDSDLQVAIHVADNRFYRRVVLGGGIGVAESLADGDWSCNDLTALVRLFVRNLGCDDVVNGRLGLIRHGALRIAHFLRRNTIGMARQNIVRHYDLSNDFFRLFLDDTMTYSSGLFRTSDTTMRQASLEKIDRACQLLNLGPHDHLLEIGTGWGSLAVHAARHYGCRVTTTTISDEQYQYANRRFRCSGVADRISLLQDDYRNLSGQYDKLVSIEMIEAVGHQYFDTFFRKCGELLKPDGEMLIQAITIVDHRFDHHCRTVDFIKRFIFPGGCLPSSTALLQSMARTTRLRLVHLTDFAEHYAKTLQLWRQSFHSRIEDARQLGFDDRFLRLWDYYFAYCEAAFLERHVNVSQMLFANHRSRVDPIRRNPEANIFSELISRSEQPIAPHLRNGPVVDNQAVKSPGARSRWL